MKNKEELLERIDKLTENGDLQCYALVTDTGCSIVGSDPEILTLLSLFSDTIINKCKNIDRELVLKCVQIGTSTKEEKIDMLKENLMKLKSMLEECE